MSRRWLRLIAALLAFTLLASACGDDDDDDANGGGTTTEDSTDGSTGDDGGEEPSDDGGEEPSDDGGEEPSDDGGEEPSDGGGEAVGIGHVGEILGDIQDVECSNPDIPQGGEITMGMFGEIQGLDPAKIQGGASLGYSQLLGIYDAMMYKDPISGELIPGLVMSVEGDDNINWTLTLREGVSFADGTPVDADAFIYNIEYHQNPDNGSGAAEQANSIISMTKVDDLTVELATASPQASFPSIFSDRLMFLFSPAAQQALGEEFNTKATDAGAGPYTVEEWVPDEKLVLVRNENYYRPGCPYLDKITFVPIVDDSQRFNALENGDLDIMYLRVPALIAERREKDDYNRTLNMTNLGGFIMLNNLAPPFNVRDCRAAFAYAMDLDFLNDVAFEGTGIMDRGVFKPGSPWLDESVVMPEYDADMASELAASCEEELGGPFEFTVRCTTAPENQDLIEGVVTLLNEVGISAETECTEVGEMVSAVFGLDYAATTWATPIADDPDPSLFVTWFGDAANGTADSPCGPAKSARNWGNWCNEQVDELLTAGREATSFDDRFAAYSELQQVFAEELPLILLTKTEQGYFWTDDVANVQYTTDGALLVGFVGYTGG